MSTRTPLATAYLTGFTGTKDHGLRAVYVEFLDGVWPALRCSYDPQVGMKIHYRSDLVTFRQLPKTLVLEAAYVEEVTPTGRARVMKSPGGETGWIPQPTRPLSDLTGELPRRGRTVWDWILGDD